VISTPRAVLAVASFVLGAASISLLTVTGHLYLSLLLTVLLIAYGLAEITVWELRNLATRRRYDAGLHAADGPLLPYRGDERVLMADLDRRDSA